MALVLFKGKLYRLPAQTKFSETRFRDFQERNHDSEVMIYAPEGGHDVVPILELAYAGDDQAVLSDMALLDSSGEVGKPS